LLLGGASDASFRRLFRQKRTVGKRPHCGRSALRYRSRVEAFTNLEGKALDAFAKLSGEPDLFWQWVRPGGVVGRENSGHGFLTTFTTPVATPQWSVRESFQRRPIVGPTFQLIGFDEGTVLEFLLWDQMIEAYQLGSSVDLKQYDLLTLDGTQVAFEEGAGWSRMN